MCEWVEFCPGTGESIDNAPCKVAVNFLVPAEIVDTVWDELLAILERDELTKSMSSAIASHMQARDVR